MSHAISDLSSLREAVRRIESQTKDGSGPGTPFEARSGRRVPLGIDALDGLLGGGLKPGCLHEVVAETPRDEAAASGFAASLAGLVARGRALVWILDDRVAWEVGTPYRPGLAAHGIDPERMLLVKTKDAATTLWATEEALKGGAPVVLTELWRPSSYDLAASRRLMLMARAQGATSLVVPLGLGQPETLSSGADTRFAVAAAPNPHVALAAPLRPAPGPSGFAVRLVRRRGSPDAPAGGYDRMQVHQLAWDRTGRRFGRSDGSRIRQAPGPTRPQAPAAQESAA